MVMFPGVEMAAEDQFAGFQMTGSREVMASGAPHIEQQVSAIESAVADNPGFVFDLARTLLESVCKTILTERGQSINSRWNLPTLVQETMQFISLVPAGVVDVPEAEGNIKKTVEGLSSAIIGIGSLRNAFGFASHGREPSFVSLDRVQAILVARSADAIVDFLYKVHRGQTGGSGPKRRSFGEYPEFDDYVDEQHEAPRIFDLEFRPSEVLFHVDLKGYDEYRQRFESEEADAEQEGLAHD
jgi:hypothetical protein